MAFSGYSDFWNAWNDNGRRGYAQRQFVKSLPFIGNWMSAMDNTQAMDDYLKNRGLDYSDVRYNSAPFGQTLGGAVGQSSVSAMNLYRSASKQSARKGGRGRPPTGPIPIGLAKEYVTPTGKYTRKYYQDFRGGKVRGGQYHVNQNGRKQYPSTYRRYRGY